MNRRNSLILTGLIFIFILGFQAGLAAAHTPGPMTLEYNEATDILTVSVTHVTDSPTTHYIYEIVVEKNSVQVDSQTYTSQSDPSEVVETFTIDAEDGDVFRVTAKCSVAGQVSQQLTIGQVGADSWLSMTLIIASVIVTLGIVAVLFIMLRRR